MRCLLCWKGISEKLRFQYIIISNVNQLKCFSTNLNGLGNEKCDNKAENQSLECKEKITSSSIDSPEEPTTCCMSGCANCVWLDYAENLCKYYQDGGEKAIREINERISDPNIKAYILHEIRMRNKK